MASRRISRDGRLIVPPAGSRFADLPPRDLRWVGALLCAVCAAGTLTVILRFVEVL